MKKIFNKLSIVLLAVMAVSCADLTENPVGILSPDGFFKTKKDVTSAVMGGYAILATEPLYGRQFTSALMLRDDMCDIGNRATAADRIQINDFTMDALNPLSTNVWRSWYTVVSAANTAETGAISLNLPEAEINPLIAEARFLRAFAYFHLVRLYGDVMYLDKPVTDPESVKTMKRMPEADIYKKILADLEFAKQWLPEKQVNDVRSRATKGAAATYLSSVYLTLGDYAKAYTEAKFVIDNRDKFGYRLEADYQDLYRGDKTESKEMIFTMDFLGNRTAGDFNQDLLPAMVAPQNLAAGFGVNVPTLRVYQTWDARDYRKKVSFLDTLVVGTTRTPYTAFRFAARPHVDKWRRFPGLLGQADGRDSDYNYPDFRYAEVLLIAAEALAETSGVTAEAIGYVNQVRARARNAAGKANTFPADVTGTPNKADFINLVLEDRRLELSFEFKRWYDIKRRRLGDADKGNVFGPNSLEPRTSFNPTRDYLFPIPKTEIDLNPNITQNPGY
jgi:starch-binding outer membrane protein, SusD/RagB family